MNLIRKFIIFFLLSFTFSLAKILVAEWEGPITPITADYVERSIEKAKRDGGKLYILLLNTPGGLVESMRKIIQSFQTAPFPVVVYVYPPGGRAASAGAIITISGDIAAMSPGTNIGAAHPVLVSPQGEKNKDDKKKDVMMEKVMQDMLALVRAIAQEKGRNVKVIEKMITESLSLSAEEALKKKVIDLIAYNLEDLLKKIDGKKVKKLNAVYTIKTKGEELVHVNPILKEKLLKIITNPTVSYLLLMIGFYGIFFELYNPGTLIPGIVGAICLLLGLYGLSLISINWLALLLIILGIFFIVLELITPTFGALALGGAISIFLGSIFLIEESSPYGNIPKQLIFIVSVLSTLFFLGVGYLGLKAQKRRKLTGIEGMIGEEGKAISDFRAGEGKVFVHGEIWNAFSKENIRKGDRIKVVDIKGLKLIVKKVTEEGIDERNSGS